MPDESRVAAGAGGSIKLWDSHTRQQLASLKADGHLIALEFLPPNGDVLVSLTDKEARLWRAPAWEDIEK